MQQPGLHGRHRDKNGEISRKHGNTLVSTLRKIYGSSFAPGAQPGEKLSEVLVDMDEPSLSEASFLRLSSAKKLAADDGRRSRPAVRPLQAL